MTVPYFRMADGCSLETEDTLHIYVPNLTEEDYYAFIDEGKWSTDAELVFDIDDANVIAREMPREEAWHIIGDLVRFWYRNMEYPRYLKTIQWYFVRRRELDDADERCRICNSTERIEVHHRTYERRGREQRNDVVALCRNCHATFHHKLPKGGDE